MDICEKLTRKDKRGQVGKVKVKFRNPTKKKRGIGRERSYCRQSQAEGDEVFLEASGEKKGERKVKVEQGGKAVE